MHWAQKQATQEVHVNYVISTDCSSISNVYIEIELKSLILAQIERWRYA